MLQQRASQYAMFAQLVDSALVGTQLNVIHARKDSIRTIKVVFFVQNWNQVFCLLW